MVHNPLTKASCEICGGPLDVHETARGTICSRPECKQAQLRETLIENARREQVLQDKGDAIRERLVAKGEIGEQASLAIIPVNTRPLKPVPRRHITAFRDRLLRVISKVTARRWSQDRTPPTPVRSEQYKFPEVEDPRDVDLVIHCCSTCSGHCCPQGGDHAFLHEETIWSFMDQNPKLRPAEVLEAYLSRVGDRHFEGSCVYHDDQGCRLPREMRSCICNDYLCKGLSRILAAEDEVKQQSCIALAVEGEEVVRVARMDPQGNRTPLQPNEIDVEQATSSN